MDFLKEVENKLDLPDDEKSQVMKELRSHYCDLMDEYTASGMSEDEAAVKASRKMGDPADIARRTQSSHWGTTWKSAILAALPFVIFALLKADISIKDNIWMLCGVIIAVIMLAASVRELVLNRRPVWLATWLPMSIGQITGISLYIMRPDLSINNSKNMPSEFLEYLIITIVINAAIWGLVTMWLYKDSIKHQVLTAGILISISIVMIAWQKFGWLIETIDGDIPRTTITFLISTPFLLLIAIRFFSQHPYGNASLASLFMFTVFWSYPDILFISVINVIVLLITVSAYTLYKNWDMKLKTLIYGMLISSGAWIILPLTLMMITSSSMQNSVSVDNRFFISMVLIVFIEVLSILIILAPLLLYKKSHSRKPVPVK